MLAKIRFHIPSHPWMQTNSTKHSRNTYLNFSTRLHEMVVETNFDWKPGSSVNPLLPARGMKYFTEVIPLTQTEPIECLIVSWKKILKLEFSPWTAVEPARVPTSIGRRNDVGRYTRNRPEQWPRGLPTASTNAMLTFVWYHPHLLALCCWCVLILRRMTAVPPKMLVRERMNARGLFP